MRKAGGDPAFLSSHVDDGSYRATHVGEAFVLVLM